MTIVMLLRNTVNSCVRSQATKGIRKDRYIEYIVRVGGLDCLLNGWMDDKILV